MKLYTEEQIRQSLMKHQNAAMLLSIEQIDYLIEEITPIELPNDEDIEKESPFSSSTFGFEQGQYQGFLLGAKWIKDKILNK